MKQHGRKSFVGTVVLPPDTTVLDIVKRLDPPEELTKEQAQVWVKIVKAEPADWFTASTVPLLLQYCRHTIEARRVAELLKKPLIPPKEHDRYLRMQDRETKNILVLATKMRLTQRSTMNQRGNRKQTATRKPWEGKARANPSRNEHQVGA